MFARIQKFLNSTWALYLIRGGIIGLQFLTALALARLMGLAQFGVYSVMWVSTVLLTVLLSGGFPNFLLRSLPARRALGVKAEPTGITLWMMLLFPLIMAAIIGVLYFALKDILPQKIPSSAYVMLIIGSSLSYCLTQNLVMYVRVGISDNWGMVMQDAVPHLIFICGALSLYALQELNAFRLFAVFLCALTFINALLCLYLVYRKVFVLNVKAPKFADRSRSYWGYGLSGSLSAQLDMLIVGALFPAQTVGIYAIIKRMSNFVSFPSIIAIWAVATKISSRHAVDDAKGLRDSVSEGITLVFLPSLLIAAALLATVPIWSGIFDIPPTSWLLPVVLLILGGNLISTFFSVTFLTAHQCGYVFQALICRAIGTAILLFGALGMNAIMELTPFMMSALWVLQIGVMNLALWWFVRRKLKIDTSVIMLFRRIWRAKKT